MDPLIGDLECGDVLVEGDTIAAVGPDLSKLSPGHDVVDATDSIIVPGFVDTHRHMWEGLLRGRLPEATLESYFERMLFDVAPRMTADEIGLSEALSARASLDAGITTVQDTSDINDAPERTDAIVAALQDSGLRAVFAFGLPRPFVKRRGAALPSDVRRVRHELLPDDTALVTMALSTTDGDDDAERHNAALAAELDVRTAHHVRATILPSRLARLGALRPGTTFVHGNGLSDDELRVIADSDGSLSIAPFIEEAMQLGRPMIGAAHLLNACLSVDVEVTGPTDMFTQMRLAYLAARRAELDLDVRDVLAMATTNGARALGLERVTGSVSPGKQADLLLLRADLPSVRPGHDPYASVVLQLDRASVDTVLVGGVVHKRGGHMATAKPSLADDADRALRRLFPEQG